MGFEDKRQGEYWPIALINAIGNNKIFRRLQNFVTFVTYMHILRYEEYEGYE